MKKNLILVILLVVFSFILLSHRPEYLKVDALNCNTKFLHIHQDEFYLDGKEYRQISCNKFDLFLQWLEGGKQKEKAKKALKELGEHNFKLIRIIGSPFFPAEFNYRFFDDDPSKQRIKRKIFFKKLDEMLDKCDEYGIKVVFPFVWNIENIADLGHHSLYEGVTNPNSEGAKKVEEYIVNVVERYKNRPTIAMWEIGNEWNLYVDLKMSKGVFKGDAKGDNLHPGPLVRDKRNNISSFELTLFFQRMSDLIRQIDKNHLITSGNGSPRPSAMHLLAANLLMRKPDFTRDNFVMRRRYLAITHLPFDALSIHHYGSSKELAWYQSAAEEIGKPLFVGEIGPDKKYKDLDYRSPRNIQHVKDLLRVIRNKNIPIVLFWAYSDDRDFKKDMDFQLRYGQTDEVLNLIEDANRTFH